MSRFTVNILGCGSATPTLRHAPSSQVVEVDGRLYMADCGEGTQMQLRRSKLNFQRLKAVFISHTHGDHCLGLVPMLSSFTLIGRTQPLHIYAPKEYMQLFQEEIKVFCFDPGYDIVYHPVDTASAMTVYDDDAVSVKTIPLQHRVPCCGFLFEEHPSFPHIRRDMIEALGIPAHDINNIKKGASWQGGDGTVYPHEQLTTPPSKPRRYAYCSDTKYMEALPYYIKGVDLLYHEATYGDDRADMARQYFHSTARDAARVALQAEARQLLIGHYSSRYKSETLLLEQAQEVFANTILAQEGMTLDIIAGENAVISSQQW